MADWSNLTKEEKVALQDDTKRDKYVAALSLCICCTEVALEDIFPDKEDKIEEKCNELECPADPATINCDIEKPDLPNVN